MESHKREGVAPARVAHWLEHCPVTKRLQVQFLVRAHAQVAGLILVWEQARATLVWMCMEGR